MTRIRLWPLRRDYHSGVLIGAGGRRRSDWSAREMANTGKHENRSIALARRAIDCTRVGASGSYSTIVEAAALLGWSDALFVRNVENRWSLIKGRILCLCG